MSVRACAARRVAFDGERAAALTRRAGRVATISAHAVDVPGAGHRPMEERPRRVSRRGAGPARAAEREATGVDARAGRLNPSGSPIRRRSRRSRRRARAAAIPTAEAVEAALAEAREGDEAPSEDEAAEATRRRS